MTPNKDIEEQSKYWYCQDDELWEKNGIKCPICKKYSPLDQQRQEIVRMVEGMRVYPNPLYGSEAANKSVGYNQALDDIKELLTNDTK